MAEQWLDPKDAEFTDQQADAMRKALVERHVEQHPEHAEHLEGLSLQEQADWVEKAIHGEKFASGIDFSDPKWMQ